MCHFSPGAQPFGLTALSVYSSFQPAATAVPVLGLTDLTGLDAERPQLGTFPQAALHLGEAGEAREPDHVVPQPHGVRIAGQPADHRAEERDPGGRLEVDDRRSDVLAG